jgi:DedD protein
MDQGLKERLVGAAVLVAIAVWLIPWVLDGPEAPLETRGSSLQLPAAEEPMPMRTQTLRLGDPEPSAESEPATAAAAPPSAGVAASETEPAPNSEPPAAETATAAAADAPVVARAEPQREPAVATAPPPKPAPAAPAAAAGDWIVQLGSFGEEANARRLAERSGTFGYKAEVSSYRSGGRTLYRVRVGPARSRAEADATASALKAHGIKDASVVAAR